jgi:hypothetical protein
MSAKQPSTSGAGTIQLCLVSDSAATNLVPLLDPRYRPDQVALVVAPRYRQEAEWFSHAIKPVGLGVTLIEIDNSYEVAHIAERIGQWLTRHGDRQVVLNASGGTQPMSLAAYQVCRERGLPVFHINPHTDQLLWLHPYETEPHELADRVRLPLFLRTYGSSLETMAYSGPVDAPIRGVCQAIVDEVGRFQRPLGRLNWLASQASETLCSPPLPDEVSHDSDFHQLVDYLEQAGILTLDGERLRFPDEEMRFLANGGWLERHLHSLIYGLQGEKRIHDLGSGIEIERQTDSGPVDNELDVAFLCNNHLYLIECKTKRWGGRGSGPSSDGNNALYRLDTLKELLAGIHGYAMLVSYQNIPRSVRRRADDLGIPTCAGGELRSLPSILRHWVE